MNHLPTTRRGGLAIGGEIGELRDRMRLDLLAAASGRDVRRSSIAQTAAEALLLLAFRELPPPEAAPLLQLALSWAGVS